MYHKTTLCKYRNDRRWHLFTIKKTPCQPNSCANVLQKSWWCGLFSSRNCTVPKCSCFLNTDDDWLRHKNTRGWLPPCQPSLVKESLSDLGGLVFIAKNIQHECSKDHHWDHHMRTNTSGQYTLECHSAKCVYPWTSQCNFCKDNR